MVPDMYLQRINSQHTCRSDKASERYFVVFIFIVSIRINVLHNTSCPCVG